MISEGVTWDDAAIKRTVDAYVGGAGQAVCVYLVGRIKENLSVAAPRMRVLGKRGKMAGVLYYRASTPASAGAPPRKLSGALRQSIRWRETSPGNWSIESPLPYGLKLEKTHPYIAPVIAQFRTELQRVAAQGAVKAGPR